MDPETAQIVLVALTVVGVVVWLAGLQFLSGSYRAVKALQPAEAPLAEPLVTDVPAPPSGSRLAGSAEVDGQASGLAGKAASILATGNQFGSIKIIEKTNERIIFERLGSGRWFQRGELHFTAVGQGRSRVDWAAELSNVSWLLWLGGLFQVLGLIALVVGSWAIYTYVVPSPDPAVRSQAVQMVQAVHFLWPPFLLGSLYRRGPKEVTAQFEALTHNLPF